jgi:hypothetical protein
LPHRLDSIRFCYALVVAMVARQKWTFLARFRANAYGRRGSSLAIRRLREAVCEIIKVARTDPVQSTEGAIGLIERLWPALQGIDTSSGALGNGVQRTLQAILPVVIAARPIWRHGAAGWIGSIRPFLRTGLTTSRL